MDTGFGPTLDLPTGSGMSAGKKPRARAKKGGDWNDVLDTVGKVASIAAPFVMGLGKKKAKCYTAVHNTSTQGLA